jgi:hypothetical protein
LTRVGTELALAPKTHVLPFPFPWSNAGRIEPSTIDRRQRLLEHRFGQGTLASLHYFQDSTSFHPTPPTTSQLSSSRVVGLTKICHCTYSTCALRMTTAKNAPMNMDAHVTTILQVYKWTRRSSHACSIINIAFQPYEAESQRIPLSTMLQRLRGRFVQV